MIALIAHDAKKGTMLDYVRQHVDVFRCHRLVATGNTGRLLHAELGLEVECVAHGPEGGDLIIGGRVAQGLVEAVLFFRDPLTAQPHEPDVSALMRVCDVHEIPLATNRATADAVVEHLRSLCGRSDTSSIGVGRADWVRPPLPPNRTCGSPASGSPVDRSPS